ncbi:hypothetical protein [Clostridium vincentii]|uniref:Uncharacterized protein n=1 Tax=Clostridium vincentii TaxID=52704 RepID=A0A2T0BBG5_9CLOT|nr:hypothetical protein [Clostridium vincentii]PRR81182.1 hypothetical protein CLVI_26860 [Clostridium vincentii]
MHAKSKYTFIAHYWLVKGMLNCKKWNFVSDDEDNSIIDSIMRIFIQSINDKKAHHFVCKLDCNLSKKEACVLYMESSKKLKRRVIYNGKNGLSSFNIQKEMIAEELTYHNLL